MQSKLLKSYQRVAFPQKRSKQYQSVHRRHQKLKRSHLRNNKRALNQRERRRLRKLRKEKKSPSRRKHKPHQKQQEVQHRNLKKRKTVSNGITMQFMELQQLQLLGRSHNLQMSYIISSCKSLRTYSAKLFAHATLN